MSSKLVRDKIPETILNAGGMPRTHIADAGEFHQALKAKLLEECHEYLKSEAPEELADILEVIDALREFTGISREELNSLKQRKADERGAFTQKIILDD